MSSSSSPSHSESLSIKSSSHSFFSSTDSNSSLQLSLSVQKTIKASQSLRQVVNQMSISSLRKPKFYDNDLDFSLESGGGGAGGKREYLRPKSHQSKPLWNAVSQKVLKGVKQQKPTFKEINTLLNGVIQAEEQKQDFTEMGAAKERLKRFEEALAKAKAEGTGLDKTVIDNIPQQILESPFLKSKLQQLAKKQKGELKEKVVIPEKQKKLIPTRAAKSMIRQKSSIPFDDLPESLRPHNPKLSQLLSRQLNPLARKSQKKKAQLSLSPIPSTPAHFFHVNSVQAMANVNLYEGSRRSQVAQLEVRAKLKKYAGYLYKENQGLVVEGKEKQTLKEASDKQRNLTLKSLELISDMGLLKKWKEI